MDCQNCTCHSKYTEVLPEIAAFTESKFLLFSTDAEILFDYIVSPFNILIIWR